MNSCRVTRHEYHNRHAHDYRRIPNHPPPSRHCEFATATRYEAQERVAARVHLQFDPDQIVEKQSFPIIDEPPDEEVRCSTPYRPFLTAPWTGPATP